MAALLHNEEQQCHVADPDPDILHEIRNHQDKRAPNKCLMFYPLIKTDYSDIYAETPARLQIEKKRFR